MTAVAVCLVVVVAVQQALIVWLLVRRPKRWVPPSHMPRADFDRVLNDTLRDAQIAMGDLPSEPHRRVIGLDGGF